MRLLISLLMVTFNVAMLAAALKDYVTKDDLEVLRRFVLGAFVAATIYWTTALVMSAGQVFG